MPKVARIGDIGVGICPCHLVPVVYITTFVTGAETVKINNRTTTHITTIGASTCGHPTTALTGSPDVIAENQKVHRLTDMGANCGPYIVITASPNVIAN